MVLSSILLEAALVTVLVLSAEWVLGSVGLWAITVANILAVTAMVWSVWRAYPALPARLRHAPVEV